MYEENRQRLADLAVVLGANVQPGQIVSIGADVGQDEMTRAIAESAYRHGAKFVDVTYFDPYVKRARIEFAGDDTLDFVPTWYGERVLAIGSQRAARISLAGPTAPGALNGLDPVRAGRDQLPYVRESMIIIAERTTNWTIVPCPVPAWAELAHPELEPEEALARLWDEVLHVCRMDEPDPIAAWRQRLDALGSVARTLNERRFDSIHFEGPGTDLTVGLLPSSRWLTALEETVDGIVHLANLPTEELFTCPDPARAEGRVRSTRPLVLADGTIIRGLEVRFESGRAVEIDAVEGAEVLRGRAAIDEGASRLGEIALVDREGRIGRLETVFYDTLLDENAVSHIALGDGVGDAVEEEDAGRVNRSAMHIDFMIGGEDVDATGITREGERIALLRGGSWRI